MVRTQFAGPVPVRVSLDSVPDGRSPVPLLWWVPVVAAVMLGVTTAAILPASGSLGLTIGALGVNLLGYGAVWSVIRPAPLRLSPRLYWPTVVAGQMMSDAVTAPIEVARTAPPSGGLIRAGRGRSASLLLRSALVLMGTSAAWALLVGWLLHPAAPQVGVSRTVVGALLRAVLDALATSILEECGIAVLILAVAGLARRYLPERWDSRAVAWWAILSGTAVRTALHIPLWGWGAIGRLGLSLVLAWLFWRTRRIWPLIVAHLLWDSVAIQAAISPSLEVKGFCALIILGWAITGFSVGCIALRHSRHSAQLSR